MFTNLANFLRGGPPTATDPEAAARAPANVGVRLRAVDADDDWVLVDNTSDSDDDRGDIDLEESVFESLPAMEFSVSTIPHSLPTLRPAPTEYYSLSRTSSTGSLPCLSFEESWFLTPPPCFTSEGPIHVETSPLENLLIEHPSMSVYQHSSPHVSLAPRPRPRSSSTGGSSLGSESSSDGEPPATNVRQAPRRGNGVPAQRQQEKQCIQLRSAQKIRQRRANQVLKRNNLDRNNKAREINSSRNKRQRRSDHQQHHSGANNNRRCC